MDTNYNPDLETIIDEYSSESSVAEALRSGIGSINNHRYRQAVMVKKDVTFAELKELFTPNTHFKGGSYDIVRHLKDSLVIEEINPSIFGSRSNFFQLALDQGHTKEEGFLDKFLDFCESTIYCSDQFALYKSYCATVLDKDIKFGKTIDLDTDFDADSLEGIYKHYQLILRSEEISKELEEYDDQIQTNWRAISATQRNKKHAFKKRLEAILEEQATKKYRKRLESLLGKASDLSDKRFERDLDRIKEMGWYIHNDHLGYKNLIRKRPLILDIDEYTDSRVGFFPRNMYYGHPVIKLDKDKIIGIYLGGAGAIIDEYASLHPHFDRNGESTPCYGNTEEQAMSLLFGIARKSDIVDGSYNSSSSLLTSSIGKSLSQISLTDETNDKEFIAQAAALMKMDKIPEWVQLIENLMEDPSFENPYIYYDEENVSSIRGNFDEEEEPEDFWDLSRDAGVGVGKSILCRMYEDMELYEAESLLKRMESYGGQLTNVEYEACKELKNIIESKKEAKNEKSNG